MFEACITYFSHVYQGETVGWDRVAWGIRSSFRSLPSDSKFLYDIQRAWIQGSVFR